MIHDIIVHNITQTENSPIVPVIIGDHRRAIKVADALLTSGIFAPSVTMPLVKSGKTFILIIIVSNIIQFNNNAADSSIRVQISATHSYDDIEYILQVFAKLQSVV